MATIRLQRAAVSVRMVLHFAKVKVRVDTAGLLFCEQMLATRADMAVPRVGGGSARVGDLGPQVDHLLDAACPCVVFELDHRVQRDVDARGVHSVVAHQVGIQQTQHRLVRDDERRLAVRLELMHQGVQPRDDVEVRLAAWVAVADLVHLAQEGLVLVLLRDLGVRESLVLARKDLIQVAVHAVRHLRPLRAINQEGGVLDERGRLVGAAQRGRPQPRLVDVHAVLAANRLLRELGEAAGVLQAVLCHPRVAADLAEPVVLALAVPRDVDRVRLGVDRREELRDAHAQEAVHAVGHHLLAVVEEDHVRHVVLGAVVLDRHVLLPELADPVLGAPELLLARLAEALGGALERDVVPHQRRVGHLHLDEDELDAAGHLLDALGDPPPPLLGRPG
eukprot:CAMPEP_0119433078 /NCGR_PEP_ID=MMETSP1335-20130426/48994_1 /TAXON_ID=259385 /ORGANISM="Chrysoculter rhomboideus, Strain RCC1486" /LENGTH=391 /DNA_ID=CAMNT_0007458911 /DNA_START=35 /DNA_END=1207 /DNA_ORIENTATION=+